MKEEVYTTPANFKRGKLIGGSYHIIDLIILAVGFFVTVIGCLICIFNFRGILFWIGMIVFITIGFSSWFLTISFPAYHNVLGFLIEMYDYLLSQKEYPSEGVIYYDEEKEEREKRKNITKKYTWE